MPLVPNTPQQITDVKVLGTANYFAIFGVSQTDRSELGEEPWMTVQWAAGNQDAETGKISWIKQAVVELRGQDLLAVMGATINGVLAVEMKILLYQILQSKGVFPAGTIS